MSYVTNREFGDGFLASVRDIVGPLLLEPAPVEMDVGEATDLVVLRARDMRIGCRVRRGGYCEKYPHDFTLRSRVKSGTRTERDKIIDGWGDWLFYGHADAGDIGNWMIVDLHAFRAAFIRGWPVKCGERANGDGTHFYFYDVTTFPPAPAVLVASNYIGLRKAA